MSGNINLALKRRSETDGDELPQINLSLSLSDEKTYRIIEMLKGADEEKGKEAAESIIRILTEQENELLRLTALSEFEEAATFLLSEFGIPAHTKGYRYLKEALVMVAQSAELIEGVTKRLYPAIAEHHGTTPMRVERVMRHAIESGCTKGDTQALYHYFPHSITKDKLKPTNAEFIAVMSDVVKKRVSKRQLIFADI